MRLVIAAIGRPGRGPEAQLADDYAHRATLAGRPLALGPLELLDLEPRKAGREAEGALILKAAEGAHLIACDEHGRDEPSRGLAAMLATLRDQGERKVVFAIGGADGHPPEVLARASASLSLGRKTWPHALARAMLAEQLYRAVSILAGSPYHRD